MNLPNSGECDGNAGQKMAMGGLLGAREELRVLVPRRDQSWRRGELAAAATMADWRRCVCTWGRKGCFYRWRVRVCVSGGVSSTSMQGRRVKGKARDVRGAQASPAAMVGGDPARASAE
jgi:hypothetical protein